MTTIRVVDTETTGLDDPAEMVEIGWTDVIQTDAGWKIASPRPRSQLVNPGMPIGFGAMAVHHITPDMVGSGMLPAHARTLIAKDADILCAHNASFEARFVRDHDLPWICTFKAARTLWPDLQGHGNGSIRYERGLCPHDARALPSHRAGPDTWVTAHILVDLLKEASVQRLIEIAENPVLQRRIDFGEHAGKLWSEVPESYLHWIIHKSNMPNDPNREDEVFTARQEVKRRSSPAPEVRSEDGLFVGSESRKSCESRLIAPDSASRVDSSGGRERKGGAKATRAAIICGERAFWVFLDEKFNHPAASSEQAADWLRKHCNMQSRADLDHDPMAAEAFRLLEKHYRLWLDGYE